MPRAGRGALASISARGAGSSALSPDVFRAGLSFAADSAHCRNHVSFQFQVGKHPGNPARYEGDKYQTHEPLTGFAAGSAWSSGCASAITVPSSGVARVRSSSPVRPPRRPWGRPIPSWCAWPTSTATSSTPGNPAPGSSRHQPISPTVSGNTASKTSAVICGPSHRRWPTSIRVGIADASSEPRR